MIIDAHDAAPSDVLRLVLGTVLDAAVATDDEGVVVAWNGVAEKTFGWHAEEALGRNLNDLIVPVEHREAHLRGMRHYQTTGEARVLNRLIEINALHRDGRQFPIELSITLAPGGSGAAFVGFMRDISDRQAADAALRQAQQRAADLAAERDAILSQLGEAVIIADAEGVLTFVNEAAERLHGMRLLGVAPDEYSEAYHLFTEGGDPYPPRELPLARAVRGETVENAVWRIRRPDGSVAFARGNAKPLLSSDGERIGAVLTARDETERHKVEQQVRENEARLRALTDNLPGGAVYQIRMKSDGSERKFVYLSQSYERLSGVPVADVLDDPARAYEAFDPEDRPRLVEAEQEAIRAKSIFDLQARFRRTDGEVRWCRFISAPREQEDGWLIWDGLQIDITSRVEAEMALRELNAALEARVAEEVSIRERVWAVTKDLFVISDSDGVHRRVNPAWSTEMGYDSQELVGTPFDALVHPADQGPVHEAFASLQRGRPVSDIDVRIRAKDGTYRWYSWTAVADDAGFYAAGRDITRRVELEEQLRQAQKMEAVGQLTGGIAHDFNNFLTIIRSAVDMMRRRELPEDKRARYIDAVAETVDRASRLTGQLLAFARRQPLKPETVDLSTQVPIVVDLVRPLLGSRISVRLREPAERLFTRVDLNQFETALMNLLINARDAMDGDGEIEISLANSGSTPTLREDSRVSNGFVAMSVADTGHGIVSDQLSQIFEPFFTTKGVGKGSGLGLSQVYGFVRQSGGDIEVKSRVGDGTVFTLYLPRSDPAFAVDTGLDEHESASARSGARVLVVEDDELVGQFSTEMLHDLGYDTTLVTDANEALELLNNDELRHDVVFTDVMMPGMNGIELAQAIRERHPGLPVLLTSGYSEILAKDGTFGFPLLSKPYSAEALSRELRKATSLRL